MNTNQKFQLAVGGLLQAPGALADRYRQVVSVEKLHEAVSSATSEHPRKPFAGLFLIAGGVGKTIIFGSIARECIRQGLRTLWVGPGIGVTSQTRDRFKERIDPELKTLLISGANAGAKLTDQQFAIITNQSLMRRFEEPWFDQVDVVLYDEAHGVLGTRNQEVLEKLRKRAIVLGFTQSDSEHPVKNLKHLFGNPIDEINVVEASNSNLICPIKTAIFGTNQRVGLDQVEIASDGDYSKGQLSRAINKRLRNLVAVQFYASYEDEETGYVPFGERGFVFCADVAHAFDVSKLFNAKLHSAFASIYQAPDRLRDSRFLPLASEKNLIQRADADQLQDLLIKEMLAAYRRGDPVTPIPCAYIHGGMRAKLQDRLHEAHILDLVKLLPNADLLWQGIDRDSASLVLNLSPTRSSIRNSQRGTRGDRLDLNNPNKINMVADFVDQDFDLADILPSQRSKRNRQRLFIDVLGGEQLVASPEARARLGIGNNRATKASNRTFISSDPELQLNENQVMRPIEIMRSISVGFRPGSMIERETRPLTADEISWFKGKLLENDFSLAQFENYAFERNPLTLITAMALYRATHALHPAPIDLKIWEQASGLLNSIESRQITVPYTEVAKTRAAFIESGLGEYSSEFVYRLLGNYPDIQGIPRALFDRTLSLDVEMDRVIWQDIQSVAEELQRPETIASIEFQLGGRPLPSRGKKLRMIGTLFELDESSKDTVASALKTIFRPLGLNFAPQRNTLNWTMRGMERLKILVSHATHDIGEAYCIDPNGFVTAAENWRNNQYNNKEYLQNHSYDDLNAKSLGKYFAVPTQTEWYHQTGEFGRVLHEWIKMGDRLTLFDRSVSYSREYVAMFSAACTQPQILPSLQTAAIYLYDLTPSHTAPNKKRELTALAI